MRIANNVWKPARDKAAREGTTVTAIVIAALRRYVASALLLTIALVGGMSGIREGEFTLFGGGTCKSDAVCTRNADIGPAVDAMIAEQVATYGPSCVDPAAFKGIPSRVLVRNARLKDFDTGVVRVVTLDAALAAAKAGSVYVLKACA